MAAVAAGRVVAAGGKGAGVQRAATQVEVMAMAMAAPGVEMGVEMEGAEAETEVVERAMAEPETGVEKVVATREESVAAWTVGVMEVVEALAVVVAARIRRIPSSRQWQGGGLSQTGGSRSRRAGRCDLHTKS